VPLYLTNARTWDALAGVLPDRQGLRIIDLGCGFGGTVAALARARPDARVDGVETAPLPYLVCRLRRFGRWPDNAAVRYQNLWSVNLAPYDVVYCFLSTEPMQRLFDKARQEMRPGSLFVSNSFTVPSRHHDFMIEVDDSRKTQVYIWRL